MANDVIEIYQVIINDVPLEYVADTASYQPGTGEARYYPTVNGSLSGGVWSENGNEKKSRFKCEIKATDTNQNKVISWARNIGLNTITLLSSSKSIRLSGCGLTVNPEFPLDADKNVSIEFEGIPAIL